MADLQALIGWKELCDEITRFTADGQAGYTSLVRTPLCACVSALCVCVAFAWRVCVVCVSVLCDVRPRNLVHHASLICRAWSLPAPLAHASPIPPQVPTLDGVDPDDAFSSVPYEKGFNFLVYLERLLGGPAVFEPFLSACALTSVVSDRVSVSVSVCSGVYAFVLVVAAIFDESIYMYAWELCVWWWCLCVSVRVATVLIVFVSYYAHFKEQSIGTADWKAFMVNYFTNVRATHTPHKHTATATAHTHTHTHDSYTRTHTQTQTTQTTHTQTPRTHKHSTQH